MNNVMRYLRIFSLIAGVMIIILAVLSVVDTVAAWDKVHPGVRVFGLPVGGQSMTEAEKMLRSNLEPSLKKDIKLEYKDQKWLLSPKQIDFEIDYKKTASKAFSIGRDRKLPDSTHARINAWTKGIESRVFYKFDMAKAKQYLVRVNEAIGKKPVDATIAFEGAEPKVIPSEKGSKLDFEIALKEIEAALLRRAERTVSIKLIQTSPDVSDVEAEQAASKARQLTSEPIILTYDRISWRLNPTDIAPLVAFNKVRSERKYVYDVLIDKDKFGRVVDALTAPMIVLPKNASFHVVGDVVSITPGQNGRKIDPNDAYAKLLAALGQNGRTISMSMVDMPPDLTTEKAKSYGIEKKLAGFTTYFNSTAASRVNNIQLIADSINGAIVEPGEVFSVNEYVGPRTPEKGYLEAPVIVNGRVVPGLGGGICQATTTLFNAAYHSGLEIIERNNHAFYISRYPAGLDATVSYGELDLKFRNDTGHHILIKFSYTSDSVTAAIYGKDGLGTEVESWSEPFSNYTNFGAIEQPDPGLAKGQRVTEQGGIEGRDITVYRTVRRNGKVVHEDTFFSRYVPEDSIIRVGTGPPRRQ